MSSIELSQETKEQLLKKDPGQGRRVSGKEWKETKTAFRIRSLGVKTPWERKQEMRLKEQQQKSKLKELKEEKEEEKRIKVEKIKERREKKSEQERYDRLAVTMHKKKVDRLKRREKRNKLLRERK